MKKVIVLALLVAAAATATASAMSFSSWGAAANAQYTPGINTDLNTTALEGCPFVSQRGDVLYFASGRPGGQGMNDIWFSVRNEDGTWGTPVNFAAVNSPYNEVCPAAHRNGKDFLFISGRPSGSCGGDDVWRTRLHTKRGWAAPTNLGCTVNSAANEASPYLLGDELYFGSTRSGGHSSAGDGAVSGDADIYVSPFDGESFGTPALAPGLNTAQNEFRPNLRRDGLEIFFDSDRTGSIGMNDIWTATRASTSDPWSGPANLGSGVNSTANDLRPSLSWDATTLYFGSTRAGGEGVMDLFVTTRSKLSGS
jgi:Tol biopolymer transport system component